FIAMPACSPFPRVMRRSLKVNGCTATTPGMDLATSSTSRYMEKPPTDVRMTRTCALTPSTLSWKAAWKPLVTDMTMVNAATPSTTPKIDTLVKMLKKLTTAHTMAPTAPTVNKKTDAGGGCEARSHRSADRTATPANVKKSAAMSR